MVWGKGLEIGIYRDFDLLAFPPKPRQLLKSAIFTIFRGVINFLKQYDLGLMLFDYEISTIRTEATLGHNNNA